MTTDAAALLVAVAADVTVRDTVSRLVRAILAHVETASGRQAVALFSGGWVSDGDVAVYVTVEAERQTFPVVERALEGLGHEAEPFLVSWLAGELVAEHVMEIEGDYGEPAR